MKYTEKVGSVETTYEGTPQEIMDLYSRINSKESILYYGVILVKESDTYFNTTAEKISKNIVEGLKIMFKEEK